MDKIKKIYELNENEPKMMTLMVTDLKDKGFTVRGEPYVSVSLFDGVKTISVNFFGKTKQMLIDAGICKEAIVKVELTKNGTYYNQNGYKPNDDPSITIADFKHIAPINPDEIFDWLLDQVKAVDSNPLDIGPYSSVAHLTLGLLQDHADAFKRSSAAVTMHHNFLSGLLYHTQRMVSLSLSVCDTYTGLDKELLVCATSLHDIGKVTCYETKDVGEPEITVTGRLLDHAVVGILMIEKASENAVYNPEKIQMLEHMLASHHGKKEWGAITTPGFPEAEMLHLIDMIDSRMNMFEEAYKGQEAGTISKDKVYGLENSYIYKPLYPEG